MKRPKDMTQDELEALPSGPYARVFTPYTAEDYEKGAVGRGREKYELRPIRMSAYEGDDIIGFRDKSGRAWSFGQFADGTWYKEPSPF